MKFPSPRGGMLQQKVHSLPWPERSFPSPRGGMLQPQYFVVAGKTKPYVVPRPPDGPAGQVVWAHFSPLFGANLRMFSP